MIALIAIVVLGLGFYFQDWKKNKDIEDLQMAKVGIDELCNSKNVDSTISRLLDYEEFYSNKYFAKVFEYENIDTNGYSQEFCDSINSFITAESSRLRNTENKEISVFGFTLSSFMWRLTATILFAFLFFNFSSLLAYRDKILSKIEDANIDAMKLGAEQFDIYTPYKTYTTSRLPSIQELLFSIFLIVLGLNAFLMPNNEVVELDFNSRFIFYTLNFIIAVLISVQIAIVFFRQNLLEFQRLCFWIIEKKESRVSKLIHRLLPTIVIGLLYASDSLEWSGSNFYYHLAFAISIPIFPISVYVNDYTNSTLGKVLLTVGTYMHAFWLFVLLISNHNLSGFHLLISVVFNIIIAFFGSLAYFSSKKPIKPQQP